MTLRTRCRRRPGWLVESPRMSRPARSPRACCRATSATSPRARRSSCNLLADDGGVVRDDQQHGDGRPRPTSGSDEAPPASSSNARTSSSPRTPMPDTVSAGDRSGSRSRSPMPGRERRRRDRDGHAAGARRRGAGRSTRRIVRRVLDHGRRAVVRLRARWPPGRRGRCTSSSPTTALSPAARINNTAIVDASNDDPASARTVVVQLRRPSADQDGGCRDGVGGRHDRVHDHGDQCRCR